MCRWGNWGHRAVVSEMQKALIYCSGAGCPLLEYKAILPGRYTFFPAETFLGRSDETKARREKKM